MERTSGLFIDNLKKYWQQPEAGGWGCVSHLEKRTERVAWKLIGWMVQCLHHGVVSALFSPQWERVLQAWPAGWSTKGPKGPHP